MASLAFFIRTCQQEEKYGTEYVGRIDERMRTLNYAQLLGMQEVLEQCIAEGKSHPWRRANETLLERVNVHIVPRREETVLNEQKKEKTKREAYVKRMNRNAKQKQKTQVLEKIISTAASQAVADVKEGEFKRQAAEKARLMEIIPLAEEKRNRYFRYTLLYCVVFIVVVCVALTDPLFIGCGIAFVAISTGVISYNVYKIGVINQVVVSEDELEQQRVVRREELIQKSLNSLKQTEIEFNNRVAKEKEERRAYRAKKRADAIAASAQLLMNAGLGEDTKATTGSEFDDIITTYPESDATNSDTELREDSDADILMSERHDSGTVDVAEPKTSLGTEGRVSVKGSNKTYHVSIDAVPQPGSKKENKDSFSNVHNNNSGEADRRLEYGGESSIVIGADAGKDKGWGISEIV